MEVAGYFATCNAGLLDPNTEPEVNVSVHIVSELQHLISCTQLVLYNWMEEVNGPISILFAMLT